MGGGGFTVDGRGRMLADFVAEADGEMSVSAGEVVTLLMPAEGLPEGWLYGQLGNKEGLVPESYVERLGASESGSERVSGGLGFASDADSGMPDFDDDALGAAYDDAFGADLSAGGGGMPIGTNPPVGVGIGNGNGLMMLSGAPVCMVEVREKSVEIAVDMIIAAKQLSPASAVALKAQLSASTIPLDLMIELASMKMPMLSATVIGQLPPYSEVQDQLVESADGFGNGAGGNAGSQGVRDCTAGGCDNDKYEDEQVTLPWARARRRSLSRQDVEGWNAELVAALRNTTALASVNHSRVNQYQLAAALREIHFAGLQADD